MYSRSSSHTVRVSYISAPHTSIARRDAFICPAARVASGPGPAAVFFRNSLWLLCYWYQQRCVCCPVCAIYVVNVLTRRPFSTRFPSLKNESGFGFITCHMVAFVTRCDGCFGGKTIMKPSRKSRTRTTNVRRRHTQPNMPYKHHRKNHLHHTPHARPFSFLRCVYIVPGMIY